LVNIYENNRCFITIYLEVVREIPLYLHSEIQCNSINPNACVNLVNNYAVADWGNIMTKCKGNS